MCIRDRGTGVDILGVQEILTEWDINNVDQVIDVLGLQGDSVDNIPGVPGIGPKTATKPVSYTHLRAHETVLDLVCRLLLEKKKKNTYNRHVTSHNM